MTTHLEFVSVRKSRGDFTLTLPDVSIKQGEILGVIGNNGAGKSTMMQLVLGLITTSEGEIRRYHDGVHIDEVGVWKKEIGFVFDDLLMYDDMKLKRLGKFLNEQYNHWDQHRYLDMLALYNVDPNKKIKKLSRGMKMKAGFAMALAHRPKLILLDEPTAGLDTKSRRQMVRLLKEAQSEGTTIIFSSHILSDMEELAETVWLMDEGVVLAHGRVEELKEGFSKDENGRIIPTEKGNDEVISLEDLHDYYLGGELD
ncbi:ABC transporter ATP-binding protein [Geomicrobium sp. JCM 19038]|uniref:ABC transporter ATP-binding protein n=1 Tax=Geomicrobium sp. JCM 19038 TaxID=1460635 RepID=UPI0005A6B738|nr:ABC transporter ATP-binding protein [Geomicrobium sp. JCM 19038]